MFRLPLCQPDWSQSSLKAQETNLGRPFASPHSEYSNQPWKFHSDISECHNRDLTDPVDVPNFTFQCHARVWSGAGRFSNSSRRPSTQLDNKKQSHMVFEFSILKVQFTAMFLRICLAIIFTICFLFVINYLAPFYTTSEVFYYFLKNNKTKGNV